MKLTSILYLPEIMLPVLLFNLVFTSVMAQGTSVPGDGYEDVSAMKCPSSWDEVTKQFRSENYWIFQRRNGEGAVSMVLRPNRETGTWRKDVDTADHPMQVTPMSYQWESQIYTGLNTLDLTAMSLDRARSDGRSARSQCESVSPADARRIVESRDRQR